MSEKKLKVGEVPDLTKQIVISAPRFQTATFEITGITPYVQNAFSKKAREKMKGDQEQGAQKAIRGKKRDKKDFNALYLESMHKSAEGWYGIPAPGFRQALISACRLVQFKMTLGKLIFFVEADGIDAVDKTPLVRIISGEPEPVEHKVNVANGNPDIRVRACWSPGWKARVRIRFDEDFVNVTDITNLLMRVGLQIGIGEGRPDSRNSAGMGWGLFDIGNGQGRALQAT